MLIVEWTVKGTIVFVLALLDRLGWRRAGKWLNVMLGLNKVDKDNRPVV
jgi:hypothetical protein